ncbi:MAG: hypothetical protein WD096_11510 [Actinomycetota bacterium]
MRTSVLRRTLRLGAVALAMTLVLPTFPASSGAQKAQLVHIVRTSRWKKPSSDPSGLSYLGKPRVIVVVDSEVEETPHWAGKNVWFMEPGGRVVRSFKTLRYSTEPTDVAVGGRAQTMYLTDDSADEIFTVRAGPDSIWGNADDTFTSFSTRSFGSRDATGIAFGSKSLFITDGDNVESRHRVFRLRRGPNGVFDGPAPLGDDVLSSFDTVPLGLSKPTDVFFRKESRHLFLVSADEKIIVEATLGGTLVNTWDMSHTSIKSPAGIVVAPRSTDGSLASVYVSDRGVDNDTNPNENDGRIFEFAL